ncbi:EF-hand domain-containing protein [Tropicimonas marinistellae]|uniref:EF-hand domain-containing protein n=1 Tax=Tropicimonas marinistellae TaxID=1739787 RepID=UPI00082B5F0B|nr:EF-hand domain-containing protein [Tropicimonas marinistellae]
MKRTVISALAIAASLSAPAMAQQAAPGGFAPGETFLSMWDGDADGTVTLEEIQARRADIFASFDADEDGALSADEFAALDAARADAMQRPDDRGRGLAQGQQPLQRAAMDTDGDGSITQAEYLAAAEGWIAVMDGNGDGVLTTADFGRGPGQAANAGPGMQRGMGQGRGQGQGFDGPRWQEGPDVAMGNRGNGQRGGQMGRMQGHAQNQQFGMMQGHGHGWRQQMAPGGADRDDMGRWHSTMGPGSMGPKGAQFGGMGQGGMRQAQPAAFQAFATNDGALWVVDARTGDILHCRIGTAPDAPAPVCVEAVK